MQSRKIKVFAFWFGVFVCAAMFVANATMIYVSKDFPAGWLSPVFFVGFTAWWGWQLWKFIQDFSYLREENKDAR